MNRREKERVKRIEEISFKALELAEKEFGVLNEYTARVRQYWLGQYALAQEMGVYDDEAIDEEDNSAYN